MTDRVEAALVWATELHRGQVRKGSGIPYVFHPMAVASLVAEGGGDEDQIVTALLHDAIEDAGGALVREEISRRFGDDVLALVEACTDTDVVPKPPWRGRKEEFLASLADAPERALLVVVADKLHNARCTVVDLSREGARIWDQFRGGREGTLWYFRAVLAALRERGWGHPYAADLERAVDDLEAFP